MFHILFSKVNKNLCVYLSELQTRTAATFVCLPNSCSRVNESCFQNFLVSTSVTIKFLKEYSITNYL